MKKKLKTRKATARELSLGKKLWRIGLREKVRVQGWNAHCKWENLPEEQVAAWIAIARYAQTLIAR